MKERQATKQAIKRPPTTPRAGKRISRLALPSLALELKAINRATAHRVPLARVPDREARASQPAATRAAAVQPHGNPTACGAPGQDHTARHSEEDPVRLMTRTWNTRGTDGTRLGVSSKTNWPKEQARPATPPLGWTKDEGFCRSLAADETIGSRGGANGRPTRSINSTMPSAASDCGRGNATRRRNGHRRRFTELDTRRYEPPAQWWTRFALTVAGSAGWQGTAKYNKRLCPPGQCRSSTSGRPSLLTVP